LATPQLEQMRYQRLIFIVIFALAFVSQAGAATKKNHPPQNQGQGQNQTVVLGAVDPTARTVVITITDGGGSTTYDLAPGAAITLNERAALITQLHPGMKVVTYTAQDETTLSQLDVKPAK
jgi:hypothetical protein